MAKVTIIIEDVAGTESDVNFQVISEPKPEAEAEMTVAHKIAGQMLMFSQTLVQEKSEDEPE